MKARSSTLDPVVPYKSVAGALLFTVILGPVGLLYASFWGGIVMITLTIAMASNKLLFVTFLLWLASCAWSVGAVESHNKKIFKTRQQSGI